MRSSNQHFSLVAADDGEPRVYDLDVAKALGLIMPTNIRATIAANRDELEMHGTILNAPHVKGGRGRPAFGYMLNEGQALVICALSRTPAAAEIRKALITVFMAWRQGKTVRVSEHVRRPPCRIAAPVTSRYDRFVAFFRAFEGQPEALAEWAEHNVAALEDVTRALSGASPSR